MKNNTTITLFFLFLSMHAVGQYNHHGVYPNLVITSDLHGYWSENYQIGSHGHGYRLYRIHQWQNTLLREMSGDLGGYWMGTPFFLNDSLGYIPESFQGSLSVFRTTDHGDSWAASGGGSAMNACIFFLDDFTGYISHYPGSSNPSFVHGLGNGNSWQTNDYRFDGKVLYFLDESTGFLSGIDMNDHHCLLRTTDYGLNWNPVYSHPSLGVGDVRFQSSENGYLVGDGGMIMRSTDGGATWQGAESPVSAGLNCIRVSDADNLVITGDSGTILRSSDGGNTWNEEDHNLTGNLIMVTLTGTRTFIQDEDWNLYSDKANQVESVGRTDVLRVYPNPASNVICIEGGDLPGTDLEVIAMNGETVIRMHGTGHLDLGMIPSGIYLLRIHRPGGSVTTKKFIRK